jgi:hypothetical protein
VWAGKPFIHCPLVTLAAQLSVRGEGHWFCRMVGLERPMAGSQVTPSSA